MEDEGLTASFPADVLGILLTNSLDGAFIPGVFGDFRGV
jgi:hypothetical protein